METKSFLLFFVLIFLYSCKSELNDDYNSQEGRKTVKLYVKIGDSRQTRNFVKSSSFFQEGDSVLFLNISKRKDAKFVYDSEIDAFVGDIIISPEDEVSVLYPYCKTSMASNVITLSFHKQDGLDGASCLWGVTVVDKNSQEINLFLYNLLSTANFIFVDKLKHPLDISKVWMSPHQGAYYQSKDLNLKTGSFESGTTSSNTVIFEKQGENGMDYGKITISLIPTSLALDFTIQDTKGNKYKTSMQRKSWNENEETVDTLFCTISETVPEFVEVCGIKWAMGNLQYNLHVPGDAGFYEHWKIADHQYDYFNPNYGNVSDSTIWDPERQDRFNWGVVGDKALEIDWRGRVKNSILDIAGKLYVYESQYGFMRPDLETWNFDEAAFGDLCYWASHGKYRLPTREEMYALYDTASCAFGFAQDESGNLIRGALFYTPIGEREVITKRRIFTKEELEGGLFLPGAGFRQCGKGVVLRTGQGFYWNSYLDSEEGGLYSLRYINTVLYWTPDGTHYGRSMRPVLCQ